MRDLNSTSSCVHLLLAALTLLLAATALAAPPASDVLLPENKAENEVGAPRPIEVVPPAPADQAVKKPLPRAKRILVRGPDGKRTYVYKCGDEFTDSPVCTAQVKPSTMLPTAEERARCKTFKSGNFIPWYCR